MNEISLYFHIPFCTKKCAYCHFYVIPDKDPFKKQLMQSLRREWEKQLPALQGKKIVSIYFGGGTPSLLGAEAIGKILEWVHALECQNPEITLEANPENITTGLMTEYALVGINRASIGIQTLDDYLLKKLTREHSSQRAQDAIQETFQAGIKNISIDLMYDLPEQTLDAWEKTLNQACGLPITHLSLYNLTIEPHTSFFKQRAALQKELPDAEASLQMYEMAIEKLAACGLKQYEISAFAKEGHFSRHNLGYWTARPFLGFGPSAFSYWEGKRFRNVANLNRYSKALEEEQSPVDFEEQLDANAKRRELLAVQLRLMSGVNLRDFEFTHGSLEDESREVLQKLQAQGLLLNHQGQLQLTKQGVLFYDTVATEII